MRDMFFTPETIKAANHLARISMKMPTTDFRVLLSLTAVCANAKDGEFPASLEYLELLTGITRLTVGKCLKRLAGLGLISFTESSGPFPRIYRVHLDRMEAFGRDGETAPEREAPDFPIVRKRKRAA